MSRFNKIRLFRLSFATIKSSINFLKKVKITGKFAHEIKVASHRRNGKKSPSSFVVVVIVLDLTNGKSNESIMTPSHRKFYQIMCTCINMYTCVALSKCSRHGFAFIIFLYIKNRSNSNECILCSGSLRYCLKYYRSDDEK